MRRRTKEILIVCSLLVIAYVRYIYFLPTPPESFYKVVNEKVSFVGMVSAYPDVRENQVRLTITPENHRWNTLLPIYDIQDEFRYGDILKVSGTLTLPESFETDAGKTFDYSRYLLAQDVFFIIKNGKVEKVEEGGNKIKKILFTIREYFGKALAQVFPVRDRGFIDGLLLGAKGGIDDYDEKAFIKTGTIHIVALSGFNVMIVAEGVMRVVRTVAYGTASYVSAGIIVILFVILSGAGATAVRAGLMAVIALIARSFGRTYLALRALVIASLLMLVINPRIIFDVSFHLSVIATFGVITLPVKLLKYFMWVPSFRGFRQMVLTTVGATLSVVPYILYVMGNFSVVSLLVNTLILPAIPAVMLLGFISGTIALISPALAIPFAYITHIGNTYIFSVVHFFADLPFASFNITHFPLAILLIFYTWLLWWVFGKKQASQK